MTENREAMLRRAVEISLFTWRRAEPGDVLDDEERMGWWGDSFPTFGGDKIGSRLWQLRRRSITAEVLRKAEEFCSEALQWMIDDGLVRGLAVAVRRSRSADARASRERVIAEIRLDDDRGTPININYDDMWRILNELPTSIAG